MTDLPSSLDQRTVRLYGLDWLRLIAFALLIFYHLGMFYVPWPWHVKSNYISQAVMPWMIAVNPWRLALLFFISGVALRFAADKALAVGQLMLAKALYLGIPLLFGMVLLVMPQTYFELLQKGQIPADILAFYPRYLQGGSTLSVATPAWNHLWYVVYLLAYTLIVIPLAPMLRKFAGSGALRNYAGTPWAVLLLTTLPFILYELTVSRWFPSTDDLIHDWGQHCHRLTIFLLGFLVAKEGPFWKSVDRLFPIALFLAVGVYAGTALWVRSGVSGWAGDFGGALIHVGFDVLYAWCCILAMLGFGQRYLDRPSKALRYLTSAIFCYYAVHQTIIVIAGYYLTRLRLGVWLEFSLLFSATVVGCLASYEVGRRLGPLGALIGIQWRPLKRATNSPALVS